MAAVDHRRAVADRNRAAIVAATERLLTRRKPLSMAGIAAEAGVSRPTLYAHFPALGDVLEAAVQRSVDESIESIEAARPREGPPPEALGRMVEASWSRLGLLEALARGAAEHLPAEHLHRTHAPLMARTQELVERGQSDGSFRSDLPAAWLVTTYYSLVHAADDLARREGMDRDAVLTMLRRTLLDVFAGPR